LEDAKVYAYTVVYTVSIRLEEVNGWSIFQKHA
jgi:hypothetical protein